MEEIEMSLLKNLKFVPAPTRRDPMMDRRLQIVKRLEEQKLLIADPGYLRVTKRFRGKGEERHVVELTQRVSPWYRENPDGSVVLVVKVGASPIEIEKGKAGIAVPSRAEL